MDLDKRVQFLAEVRERRLVLPLDSQERMYVFEGIPIGVETFEGEIPPTKGGIFSFKDGTWLLENGTLYVKAQHDKVWELVKLARDYEGVDRITGRTWEYSGLHNVLLESLASKRNFDSRKRIKWTSGGIDYYNHPERYVTLRDLLTRDGYDMKEIYREKQ